MSEPLRVIQWTTGNIGRRSLHAIIGRPDLELVGVYAHSADKVGREAAELCGWPDPTGVLATSDVDALIALARAFIAATGIRPRISILAYNSIVDANASDPDTFARSPREAAFRARLSAAALPSGRMTRPAMLAVR